MQNLRKVDVFARFGGEEFAIVLPEAGLDQAKETAERIRKIVENTILNIDEQQFKITASFGVSTFMNNSDTLELLLQKADKALYTAKSQGRNRVICAE